MAPKVRVALHHDASVEERKEYIRAKYIDRAFVQSYCSNAQELYVELENAVDTHSLEDLLQFLGFEKRQVYDLLGKSFKISHCLVSVQSDVFQRRDNQVAWSHKNQAASAFSSMVDRMLAMFEAGAPIAPAMFDAGAPMQLTT